MRKEFLMLFKRRYIYLIIMAILMIVFILLAHMLFINNAKHFDNVYDDFISDIEIYNSKEELQQLYDGAVEYLEKVGPGGTKIEVDGKVYWEELPADYLVALYGYLLEKDLPYDSLVLFDNDIKYTPFHYFTNYTLCIGYFILVTCILMGSMYQTGEVMTKMSKMVYTSGKKKRNVVNAKYGVSLTALLSFTMFAGVIMAIVSCSAFPNSGAQYCIMYTGNRLLTMNFFGFFMLNVVSHLTIATLIYTSIYYLSVILKNGIIMLCTCFVSFIIMSLVPFSAEFELFSGMWSGFIQVLCSQQYYTDMKNIALIVPYAVGAIAIAITSNFVIKRIDYSR